MLIGPCQHSNGKVAEWFKVLAWKASVRAIVPGVRIPPFPHRQSPGPFRGLGICPIVAGQEANCLASVGMRKTERCFASRRNRESGSWKLTSADESLIPDRISFFHQNWESALEPEMGSCQRRGSGQKSPSLHDELGRDGCGELGRCVSARTSVRSVEQTLCSGTNQGK